MIRDCNINTVNIKNRKKRKSSSNRPRRTASIQTELSSQFEFNETRSESSVGDDGEDIERILGYGTFIISQKKNVNIRFKNNIYNNRKKRYELIDGEKVTFRCNQKGCLGKVYCRVPSKVSSGAAAPIINVAEHTKKCCLDRRSS